MDLLKNEVVLKYFGCSKPSLGEVCDDAFCKADIASRVLSAMQELIRKGDKYLQIGFDGGGEMQILERVNDGELTGFGSYLRLPDAEQRREHNHPVEKCPACVDPQPSGEREVDVTEDAATTLAKVTLHPTLNDDEYAAKLRELVELCRGNK